MQRNKPLAARKLEWLSPSGCFAIDATSGALGSFRPGAGIGQAPPIPHNSTPGTGMKPQLYEKVRRGKTKKRTTTCGMFGRLEPRLLAMETNPVN